MHCFERRRTHSFALTAKLPEDIYETNQIFDALPIPIRQKYGVLDFNWSSTKRFMHFSKHVALQSLLDWFIRSRCLRVIC